MRLPFEEAAALELEEAAAWIERERSGYGERLLVEVARTVDRAADLPRSGIMVQGMEPGHEVRRFVVRRFPYSVVVAMVSGQPTVIAVAHGRREPGYWRARLK